VFEEKKEYRNIEYNRDYTFEEVKLIFKSYTDLELKEFIQKAKKLGQITEVRSGTFRFEKQNGDVI